MKTNPYLRGGIALGLILTLLFSCAAADTAFSFRNGVTWASTVADMMAAEGLRDGGGNYNRHTQNGYTFFYLWNRGGKTEDVYYVFRGDQPVTAYFLLSGGSDAYAAERERQTALYGSPADVSADTVAALLNAANPGSVRPDDFSRLTAWRLADGTVAALFTIGGDSYMAYFHEQRILNGA